MNDKSNNSIPFKNRFNEALEIRGIRPVDFAKLSGISESTVSQYRSGYAEPKRDKLAIIAKILKINPAWLMGLDVSMEIPKPVLSDPEKMADITFDPELVEYAWKLSKLDDAQKNIVYGMIDQMSK